MAHGQTIHSAKYIPTTQRDLTWSDDQLYLTSDRLQTARHLTDILTGVIALLLVIRFVIELFAAVNASAFTRTVHLMTEPLIRPFVGIIPNSTVGAMDGGKIETATILSMIAIAFLGYAMQQLYKAMAPVSQQEELKV